MRTKVTCSEYNDNERYWRLLQGAAGPDDVSGAVVHGEFRTVGPLQEVRSVFDSNAAQV